MHYLTFLVREKIREVQMHQMFLTIHIYSYPGVLNYESHLTMNWCGLLSLAEETPP